MNKVSPIPSAFSTAEEAEAYDQWFRAKVQESIDDPRPTIPHAEVMEKIATIITTAEQKQSKKV